MCNKRAVGFALQGKYPTGLISQQRADTQQIMQMFNKAGETQQGTQVLREHVTLNSSHASFCPQNQLP